VIHSLIERHLSGEYSFQGYQNSSSGACGDGGRDRTQSPSASMRLFNRLRRRQYTKRIILLRHGESLGNVHPTLFASKPDPSMPLTHEGLHQAYEAGRKLQIPREQSVCFYISPYLRSWQTCERVIAGWIGEEFDKTIRGFEIEWTPEGVVWDFDSEEVFRNYGVRFRLKEDPRLRELEWSGTFQNIDEMPQQIAERKKFGSFYYRFRGGENGGDAYLRVSAFLETMHRDMGKDENFVLVSHGLTLRLLLMRYYHWSVALFHSIKNFRHCEGIEMDRCESDGRFRLAQNVRVGKGRSKFSEDNFMSFVKVMHPRDVHVDSSPQGTPRNAVGSTQATTDELSPTDSSSASFDSGGGVDVGGGKSAVPPPIKLNARRNSSWENLHLFPDSATPLTPDEDSNSIV